MDWLAQDVRHALRLLRKSPGFSLIVIATLALGIGANTAIFSLLDQLLVRLLPVKDPKRLVLLSGPGPNMGTFESSSSVVEPFSHPMFVDFRDRNAVFSDVAARYPLRLDVADRGGTETAAGSLVSGTYFQTLGVGAALGRVLSPQDDATPGAHPVVVISHGYWRRRFGGDPGIVGRSISVNGQPLTVVGVAAPGFHGSQIGRSDELFVPLMMKAQMTPTWNGLGNRRVMWLEVMARLKPGVDVEKAGAGMAVLYRQALEGELKEIPAHSAKFNKEFVEKKLVILPGGQGMPELQKQLKTPLVVLMGMVGLVVLIACANVANLLLARASARQREIAVRLAIGASRAHLVRQLVVESLVLSLLGALAGLPLAAATTGALLRTLPFEGVALTLSSGLDRRVVLFALGLSVVTALLVGLVPALQSTRPNLVTALKEEGSALTGAGPLRFRKGLVVAQVALSALLLVGAGLFTRSLANLRAVDPGFRSQGLLTFSLNPRRSGYSTDQTRALLARARERLQAVPGVRAVSMAVNPLMTESIWQSTVHVEGYVPGEEENMNPRVNGVGPGFFTTMGMPLVAGREIDERDGAGAPKVAVVNETFAKKYFKNGGAIGRHIGWGRDKDLPIEIVGIVRDARIDRMKEEPQRFVFISYAQDDDVDGPRLLPADGRRPGVARVARARGRAGGGRGAPRRRAEDHGRRGRREPLHRPDRRRAVRRLRPARDAPRRGGALRRDELRGRAEDARDRGPGRARRRPPAHPRPRRRRGGPPRRPRDGDRRAGRARPRTARRVAPLRDARVRPADDPAHRGGAGRRHRARGRGSRPSRTAGRALDGAAVRVTRQ